MAMYINGTTGISGVDGSAGTPAVQGTDTNTGVYFGADTVYIATGGTVAQTVDSGQRTKFPTTIGVGGATPSTSGSGVSFPATQSASTDANTLDDYEEGSWTPANSVTTLTLSSATYTKIGRLVCAQFDFALSTNASTSAISITGLPFTVSSSNTYFGYIMSDNFNVLSAFPFGVAGGTTMQFQFSSTTGGGRDTVAYSRIVSGGVIRGTLFYFT